MNNVTLMGRVVRDPEIRYTQGENPLAFGRFTIAVNRRVKKEGQQEADFIPCVVFGKQAELVEKYFRKGSRVCVRGRIQTGSYTNKDGQKVYTTDVAIEEIEFAQSKNETSAGNSAPAGNYTPASNPAAPAGNPSFMSIPDGMEGIDELPFS